MPGAQLLGYLKCETTTILDLYFAVGNVPISYILHEQI